MDGLIVVLLCIVVALAAAGITFVLMRGHLTKRLEILRGGLEKMAQGDLAYYMPAQIDPYLNDLSIRFNHMVDQLNARLTLQKNEATNQAVLDSMPDLLFRFNADGIFLDYRNPRESNLLVQPELFLGHSVFDVLPPELAEITLRTLKTALATKQTQGFEYQLMVDGAMRNYETRHMVIGDSEVLALVRDVTERKQQEEVLHAALEQEKQLSELKSQFMTLMNHEFRTPLSVIMTSSDLLDRYRDRITEAQRAKHFSLIHEQVNHLAGVLDDILMVSRAETVGLVLETSRIDLESLCKRVIEDSQSSLRDHKLVFSAPNGCKMALFDSKLIRQAITNLISNAVKFSPPDSTIQFDLICREHDAVIRIQDHGIGISAEDQAHLFNVFYRAQNASDKPGVGLGLAIVKHAAHLHGGTIKVESTVGMGTTFTLTLPLVDNEVARPMAVVG
ncbi:MAG: ATP-binding protein [Chloroflexota bacterium]